MMSAEAGPLDTRAWLLWGAAMSLPLLTGRHPVILVEILIIVVIVRSICLSSGGIRGWGWLLRIATIAVPIGVLFNMATVRAGDQQMFSLPEYLPIVGGPVTWNAAVYGLLSGMTIVALVAVGTTVAAAIEWTAFMRLLPARAGGLAVAGSVAWSFLPQLAGSWREIRETQAARGHQWRGARDLVPLMVPLLAGGLDRSVATAEVLETRGFGMHAASNRTGRGGALMMIALLTAAVAGLYLFAIGASAIALGIVVVCVALTMIALRSGRGRSSVLPTQYRRAVWNGRDTAVILGALLTVATMGIALQLAPASLRYEPYPELTVPESRPAVVLALACLLLPAIVAPARPGTEAAR